MGPGVRRLSCRQASTSPLKSRHFFSPCAVALSGRTSVGPQKVDLPVLDSTVASPATVSSPLDTSCAPSGRRLTGNPVPYNGPSCPKGPWRRHSRRDGDPPQGCSLSGTAPPFLSEPFPTSSDPDTTKLTTEGNVGPCPLVPLSLWLPQCPPLSYLPPRPRGLCLDLPQPEAPPLLAGPLALWRPSKLSRCCWGRGNIPQCTIAAPPSLVESRSRLVRTSPPPPLQSAAPSGERLRHHRGVGLVHPSRRRYIRPTCGCRFRRLVLSPGGCPGPCWPVASPTVTPPIRRYVRYKYCRFWI